MLIKQLDFLFLTGWGCIKHNQYQNPGALKTVFQTTTIVPTVRMRSVYWQGYDKAFNLRENWWRHQLWSLAWPSEVPLGSKIDNNGVIMGVFHVKQSKLGWGRKRVFKKNNMIIYHYFSTVSRHKMAGFFEPREWWEWIGFDQRWRPRAELQSNLLLILFLTYCLLLRRTYLNFSSRDF